MSQTKTANAGVGRLSLRDFGGTGLRLLRYSIVRAFSIGITVVIAVYLTIIIANMGGQVDEIRKAEIQEQIGLSFMSNPAVRDMTPAERLALQEEMMEIEIERLGLNRPFFLRSFSYLWQGLTLNLGRAEQMSSDTGSRQVRLILIERLPATLLLWGTAQVLIFIVAILVALWLSNHYGGILDRLIIALTPISAAPAWFYGLFLILIFSGMLGMLPYGGMVAAPPPTESKAYALSVLRHLILPVAAQFVSGIFILIYNWRTFFLIYSSEDYVEMAKAKGLTGHLVSRRYVLRPTLPYIITNFMLMLISVWMGGIILETVFNWPGLGKLLYQAIHLFDTPVIVGSTVLYAYLLAVTVFFLDIIYALVDPRVRVGAENTQP